MNESNFIETIDRTNLTEQTNIRLNEITETENYFHQKINQRRLCSKKVSKYVTAFDYIDKVLVALSATSGGVSIIYERCWSSCRNSKCKFYANFFSNNRNSQKITKHSKKKKKKHDKILMLAKSKLNSIETLISQALIDMEISHEELIAIFKEKDKYKKMKENLRSENEKQKIMILSSVKSKT